MGCRHYFVVDRFEDLVDEGDSRSSSRTREISACFTTACGKARHPEVDDHNGSHRSISICIYVIVCVFVFL